MILRIYKQIHGYCKGQLKLAYIVFLIWYPHSPLPQSSMKCLFIVATKCNISIYLLSDVIYRPHSSVISGFSFFHKISNKNAFHELLISEEVTTIY